MATTAKTYENNPLYKALNAIARQKYPLDDGVIAEQDALCKCAQVENAVGGQTSVIDRAAVAASVIRKIVSEIRDPDTQHFAQMIFGMGSFEGMTSTQRIALSKKKMPGFSKSTYWKARPGIVGLVALHLEAGTNNSGVSTYLASPRNEISLGQRRRSAHDRERLS